MQKPLSTAKALQSFAADSGVVVVEIVWVTGVYGQTLHLLHPKYHQGFDPRESASARAGMLACLFLQLSHKPGLALSEWPGALH